MFKKALVVVGALTAGTVVSDGSALASWHHHGFHHHHHHERWASYFHHRHFHFAAHRHFNARHHHFAYGSHRLHALRRYASYRHAAAVGAYASGYGAETAPAYTAPVSSGSLIQTGSASYYGGGGRTAAGGHVGFATCAHRSLPFGTRVLVTNLANLRQTVLTVNDRGPFVHGRMLDVSRGAAGVLGMIGSGVARIRMEVVGRAG